MLARLAAISVIAFAGFTAAASAAEIAYTKSAANLREGPGTSYDIITTLPKNTELLVEACTATWCAVITEDDDEGFIAKSLLKANPSGPDVPFTIQIIIGPEGPFIDFGDIFVEEPDEPDPDFPEVCFYQQANFKGANFCVEEGDADNDIPGSFDNNIESILISGGLGVEVCSGVGHGGECFYYTKSQKSLPSQIRNKISSYQVDDGEGGFSGDDDDDGNIIILN
jgi:hypothetical protein